MIDLIITGTAVILSIVYFVIKIIRFIRKPVDTSGCSCSCSDCSKCPMVK